MGAMKELQIEQINLEADWADFIARLLEKTGQGKAVAHQKPDPFEYDSFEDLPAFADVVFQPAGTLNKTAVEIKVYRWRTNWDAHAKRAASYLERIISEGEFQSGILVVTLDLSGFRFGMEEISLPPNIKVWDLSELERLSANHEDLERELEELVAETSLDDVFPLKSKSVEVKSGTRIAEELSRVPDGQAGWADFEKLCQEAVEKLFGNEIQELNRQSRTTDALHRMDLIGRIATNSDSFWSIIERDFRARYVVFEFKNYSNPIGQSEIYTTEKYLFTNALRPVAIIIARNGANAGASSAIEGSLREQGKLILVVSLVELQLMLRRVDQGDSPDTILFEKMDGLLMKLGR